MFSVELNPLKKIQAAADLGASGRHLDAGGAAPKALEGPSGTTFEGHVRRLRSPACRRLHTQTPSLAGYFCPAEMEAICMVILHIGQGSEIQTQVVT